MKPPNGVSLCTALLSESASILTEHIDEVLTHKEKLSGQAVTWYKNSCKYVCRNLAWILNIHYTNKTVKKDFEVKDIVKTAYQLQIKC